MTTFRTSKEKGVTAGFTRVDNRAINDNRLSLKAKGALVVLLSKPDNWVVQPNHLAKIGPDGRDSILSGLKELENAGYYKPTRKRTELGSFAATGTDIFEVPGAGDTTNGKPVSGGDQGILVKVPGHATNGKSGAGSSGSGKSATSNKGREVSTEGVTFAPAAQEGNEGSMVPLGPPLLDQEKEALRLAAKAILNPYWESQRIKPVTPYIAIVQRIEEALTAGYPPDAIAAVLPKLPAFARNCFDWALRKHGKQMVPEAWDVIASVLADRECSDSGEEYVSVAAPLEFSVTSIERQCQRCGNPLCEGHAAVALGEYV